jgi:hypothetical protein
LIEYCDYSPPSGLSQIGTLRDALQTYDDTIPDETYYNNDLESPVLSVRYTGGARPYLQTVVQGDYETELIIREYARLDTVERLSSFIEAKNRDIDRIDNSASSVDAIISFNEEITLEDLLVVQEKYNLDIEWLRYLSTEGGGKIFVENEDLLKTIQIMENEFRTDFGNEFELVKGIGAVKATIPFEYLTSFRDESFVLVIDQGPLDSVSEFSLEYSQATIRVHWYDIFQEYVILMNS